MVATNEQIKDVLRRVMLMIGMRAANLPSVEETAILIGFIKKRFGNNTVAEVQLAFEKSVAGELDVKVEAYENFTCEYFGRIMSVYRVWASKNFNQLPVAQSTQLLLPDPIFNPSELVETAKSVFLKTKLIGLIPVQVYEILLEQKEIILDKAEKAEIRRKVEVRLQNEAITGGMVEQRNFAKLKADAKEYETKVRNECKKQAVALYFIKMEQIENL